MGLLRILLVTLFLFSMSKLELQPYKAQQPTHVGAMKEQETMNLDKVCSSWIVRALSALRRIFGLTDRTGDMCRTYGY